MPNDRAYSHGHVGPSRDRISFERDTRTRTLRDETAKLIAEIADFRVRPRPGRAISGRTAVRNGPLNGTNGPDALLTGYRGIIARAGR